MNIEIEKVEELISKAGDIFITPEGENALVSLLELQETIENAIDEAEKRLEESALKLNPNFKSLISDKVKVYYRAYGERYKIDESVVTALPENLYSVKKSYKAVPEEVEKFIEEKGTLPFGVYENDRKKSLKFSRKDKKDDTEVQS